MTIEIYDNLIASYFNSNFFKVFYPFPYKKKSPNNLANFYLIQVLEKKIAESYTCTGIPHSKSFKLPIYVNNLI